MEYVILKFTIFLRYYCSLLFVVLYYHINRENKIYSQRKWGGIAVVEEEIKSMFYAQPITVFAGALKAPEKTPSTMSTSLCIYKDIMRIKWPIAVGRYSPLTNNSKHSESLFILPDLIFGALRTHRCTSWAIFACFSVYLGFEPLTVSLCLRLSISQLRVLFFGYCTTLSYNYAMMFRSVLSSPGSHFKTSRPGGWYMSRTRFWNEKKHHRYNINT